MRVSAAVPIGYSGQGFSLRGEKGRLVLPPSFRKSVAESSDGKVLCLAIHDRWKCLTGFGLSRRAEMMQQVDREEELAYRSGKPFDREMRMSQLFGFNEVPFDASGRFIIPEYLAELGGLEDAVFFQGAGDFFTLWNPANLQQMGPGWEGAQAACRMLEAEARSKASGKGRKG
jgi:MraZ protein